MKFIFMQCIHEREIRRDYESTTVVRHGKECKMVFPIFPVWVFKLQQIWEHWLDCTEVKEDCWFGVRSKQTHKSSSPLCYKHYTDHNFCLIFISAKNNNNGELVDDRERELILQLLATALSKSSKSCNLPEKKSTKPVSQKSKELNKNQMWWWYEF